MTTGNEPNTDPQFLCKLFVRSEMMGDIENLPAQKAYEQIISTTLSEAGDGEGSPGALTIHQALHHVHTNVSTLDRIKNIAKKIMTPKTPQPSNEAALVIYYLAIGTARLRHNAQITTLPDHAICTGLNWAHQQSWIDAPTRQLTQRCMTLLHGLTDQSNDSKQPRGKRERG